MGTGVLAGGRGRALQSLIPLLGHGIATEGDADEFLLLYTQVWGAEGISIGQRCFFGPWARTENVNPDWMVIHGALRDQDPSESFLASSPDATPFITSAIWDARTKRTQIYGEFLRHGYADSMVQRYPSSALGDVFSAVLRPRGARRFTTEDAAIARMLHPHISAALATRSAMHALALEGARGPTFHAFVSLPELTVTMNANARSSWARILGEPLGARGVARVERLLRRLALDLLRGAPSARSRLVLPNLRAEAVWVPPAQAESHRALLLFFEERRKMRALSAPAAELLSPMQRRVVECAANGLNNVEIASVLAIAVETVRTHLRAAMRRLRVGLRADLVVFTEPAERTPGA